MIGTYVLSAGYYDAYYLRAQKVRTLIKKDFEDCFNAGVHAMLTPATPSAAFGLGEKGGADPVEMYLNDVFTVTANMAGLPGISIPAGLDSQELPLGLQLIGRPFDEETLFALAAVVEQAAGRFEPGHGGDCRLLVGCRYGREILIALHRLLAAELSAAKNENNGDRGDHAADDDTKCAIAVVLHDTHPTFSACAGSDGHARQIGGNRCRIWAIWGYDPAWITTLLC